MREDNGFDDVVRIVTPLLAIASAVLALVGLTDFGQDKTFRFVLGEMAAATAVGHSFQTARGGMSKFAPLAIAVWFIIASMNFAQAAGFVAR